MPKRLTCVNHTPDYSVGDSFEVSNAQAKDMLRQLSGPNFAYVLAQDLGPDETDVAVDPQSPNEPVTTGEDEVNPTGDPTTGSATQPVPEAPVVGSQPEASPVSTGTTPEVPAAVAPVVATPVAPTAPVTPAVAKPAPKKA